MGANEKHAATYHGVRHDPDLNLVRAVYAGASPVPSYDERAEAFDRMIAKVRAEAKAEALREVVETLQEASCPEHGSAIAPIDGVHWRATGRVIEWLRARANQYKEGQ